VEATSLGVAVLAAVAVRWHRDVEAAVRAMTATGASFAPGPNREHYGRLYRDVYQDLYPALRERLQRLAELRRTAPPGATR
jgi:ribulose kinase